MNRVEPLYTFKELGFTEYEAKIYLALLSQHPATAYTLSQISGVPHSRVYDIARRLIKRGLAIRVDRSPDRFSPLSPNELLSKLKRESQRHISALKKSLDTLRFQSDFDPVWNITDREEALAMIQQLISEASQRIYLGIWDEELEEVSLTLKRSASSGVEISLLVYGSSELDFGQVYYHSTEMLASGSDRTVDCVVDSAACLSGSLHGGEGCQVVWTRNPGLVQSIEEYIIHDLYLAEIQKHLGDTMEEHFGKNLSLLRKKFGR
jgi:sugar-specific transcriptional regulator TrmB